ncbi:hypothetical protein [Thaumasiovibrio subtropicus]|uniref:hypothetical protein n=1 Tax=Thaumasiovibrio subtropicus TaxID=1891207 RepID=UPI000B34DAA5|nr:hypothetical protein [Thaumasiovibrio subtropicus]
MKYTLLLAVLISLNTFANTSASKAYFDSCMENYHNESLCLGYAMGVSDTVKALECTTPLMTLARIEHQLSQQTHTDHQQLVNSFAVIKSQLVPQVCQPLPISSADNESSDIFVPF